MSGHTPGPWFVGDKYDSERIGPRVVVLGDDGACGDPECCGSPTYQIEIQDADAKLIAAAPALADDAEKLTALLAHIVECAHYAADDDTDSDVLKRIENEAREVANAVGYDGTTCAALRAAGRIP